MGPGSITHRVTLSNTHTHTHTHSPSHTHTHIHSLTHILAANKFYGASFFLRLAFHGRSEITTDGCLSSDGSRVIAIKEEGGQKREKEDEEGGVGFMRSRKLHSLSPCRGGDLAAKPAARVSRPLDCCAGPLYGRQRAETAPVCRCHRCFRSVHLTCHTELEVPFTFTDKVNGQVNDFQKTFLLFPRKKEASERRLRFVYECV